jgi:hypothetical protein
MSVARRSCALGVVAVGAFCSVFAGVAVGARWTIVPTPRGFFGGQAVAASAPAVVWAFGFEGVMRWDGASWQPVTAPAAVLQGGVVFSARQAWAVGSTPVAGPSGDGHGVVIRWDGQSWRVVLRTTRRGALTGLSRVPATHRLWAVGFHDKHGAQFPLIRHRDAAGWHRVAGAPVGRGELAAVASGRHGSWAVGARFTGSGIAALAERWTGRRWVTTSVPHPAGISLRAVAAVPGTRRAWAVGFLNGADNRPVSFLWSHGAWHQHPIDLGRRFGELQGVVSIRPGDAWAVGDRWGTSRILRTAIVHWTSGPAWQAVPTPTPTGGCASNLAGITKVPGTPGPTLWAVGDHGCNGQMLSERYP